MQLQIAAERHQRDAAHRCAAAPGLRLDMQIEPDGIVGDAEARREDGEASPAIAYLAEALSIRRSAVPAGHTWIAESAGYLAEALTCLGRLREAERILDESCPDMLSADSSALRNHTQVIGRFVELYESWNKPEEAAKWRAKG